MVKTPQAELPYPIEAVSFAQNSKDYGFGVDCTARHQCRRIATGLYYWMFCLLCRLKWSLSASSSSIIYVYVCVYVYIYMYMYVY